MTHILFEIDGPLGLLTLNNPEKHNAFDDALIADLTTALQSLDANSARGAPCSGTCSVHGPRLVGR